MGLGAPHHLAPPHTHCHTQISPINLSISVLSVLYLHKIMFFKNASATKNLAAHHCFKVADSERTSWNHGETRSTAFVVTFMHLIHTLRNTAFDCWLPGAAGVCGRHCGSPSIAGAHFLSCSWNLHPG